MPRKMAGIAMITIEASIVAIVMLRVVLDSAIHLYRSDRCPDACSCSGCRLEITPTHTSLPPKGCLSTTTYLAPWYVLARAAEARQGCRSAGKGRHSGQCDYSGDSASRTTPAYSICNHRHGSRVLSFVPRG